MKKKLFIIFLIMLIITIFQINSLYSRYKDELVGTYENDIGKWVIKVNEYTITSDTGSSSEYNITSQYFKYDDTDLVKSGKIAPGRTGYFDLYIDAEGIDVSVIYEINIRTDKITNASIEITEIENYFIMSNEAITKDNSNRVTNETNTTETGVFLLSDINQSLRNVVRVHFTWQNYETLNSQDSELGTTDGTILSIPVETNFKQYTGEEL